MPGLAPTGEQIWVRRDIYRRGGLFLRREITIWFAIFIMASSLLVSASATAWLTQMGDWRFILVALFSLIVSLVPLSLTVIIASHEVIRYSQYCPTWYYAEQLNPEQLKIYHFRKPPTIIKLANSTLDTKSKFKHYTTLTITDKDTGTSATLGLLTPEEYDRFMQYWNAAQKTLDA